jgi:hypothetical protein
MSVEPVKSHSFKIQKLILKTFQPETDCLKSILTLYVGIFFPKLNLNKTKTNNMAYDFATNADYSASLNIKHLGDQIISFDGLALQEK